jgi:hypothetical protein
MHLISTTSPFTTLNIVPSAGDLCLQTNVHHLIFQQQITKIESQFYQQALGTSVFSVNFHLSSVWHQRNKKCSTYHHNNDENLLKWMKMVKLEENGQIR